MKDIIRVAASVAVALVLAGAAVASEGDKEPEKKQGLKAGAEGTELESITVEGEDRIRIEFERPELVVDVDPLSAPGLEWDVVWSLLQPEALDLYAPLPERSRLVRSPFRARPWADMFRRGDIARFRPQLKGVASWSLVIADARGGEVARFGDKGSPPDDIGWNGEALDGTYGLPGRSYSFVVEAADRAGNKRRFVGDGFELPAYALETDAGVALVMSQADVTSEDGSTTAAVYYAATRINQSPAGSPVKITVTAPDFRSGDEVAVRVAEQVRSLVVGDPARVSTSVDVEKGTNTPAITIEVAAKAD
jgi:hypothetical protein